MKIVTSIVRILVGALFIFSGFVKFNDPVGFSYKMEEYFEVFSDDLNAKQDSFYLQVSDTRGDEMSYAFPVFKNETKKVITIKTQTDEETIEIGENEFYMTSVELWLGSNIIYEENLLYKELAAGNDSLFVSWHLGTDPANDYAESVSPLINLDNQLTLDFSENIKPQPFLSRFFEALIPFALWIGMLICVFELVLGFMLLIGYKPFFTLFTMVLMIVFFTFLTGYSAIYNKVTDCGCFGDAIKLTPWESFGKDIVLSVLIFFLFFTRSKIRGLFSNGFALKSTLVVTVLAFGYSIYSLMYLPPVNFLNFANGNNIYKRTLIPEGEPTQDVMEIVYLYEKDGKVHEFDLNTAPVDDDSWKYVDREDKIVQKAYKPKLDNFYDVIHPEKGDVAQTILENKEYQLIIAAYDITKAKDAEMQKAIALANLWYEKVNQNVWFITSNTKNEIDEYESTHQLNFRFCSADNKLVKSIIRSNPGVILLNGPVVIKNWPSKRIPSFERIQKRVKK